MWQYNVYYVCMTFSVVRYVELRPTYLTSRYAATSPRLTFKNFKLSDFLKFSDFNGAPTNSLMMIY